MSEKVRQRVEPRRARLPGEARGDVFGILDDVGLLFRHSPFPRYRMAPPLKSRASDRPEGASEGAADEGAARGLKSMNAATSQ